MYTILKVPFQAEGYMELTVLGDKHFGIGDDLDDQLLIQIRDEVMEKNAEAIAQGKKPYAYVCGIGDTLDLSIAGKFGVIGKDESVQQAMKKFKDIFMPLMLHGYYLGDVPGNHDVRIANKIGSAFDAIEELFDTLNESHGLSLAYGCPHLVLDISLAQPGGKDKYSRFLTFLTHGSGGGGTEGSIANQMFKSLNEISDADIYVQGHFHRDIYIPRYRPWFDKVNSTVCTQLQHFFTVSSTQAKGGYAAVGRMVNGGTSALRLKLYAAEGKEPKRVVPEIIFGSRNGTLKSKKVGFKG